MKFLTEFIQNYLTALLAIIAIIASVRSNIIAHKSLQLSEKTEVETNKRRILEKRTEILREVDHRNAIFGNLLAIMAEAAITYQKEPSFAAQNEKDIKRLENNINAIREMRERYEKHRNIAEQIDSQADIEGLEFSLAETRRLNLHVEQDIIKEERNLNRIREKTKDF